jgi:hypothetical protein
VRVATVLLWVHITVHVTYIPVIVSVSLVLEVNNVMNVCLTTGDSPKKDAKVLYFNQLELFKQR